MTILQQQRARSVRPPPQPAHPPRPPRPVAPAQKSKWDIKPRSIQFHIIKAAPAEGAEATEERWPRLLADKAKEKGQVTIDWARYVDEDEEKGGFDMSSFGGAQGFGGDVSLPLAAAPGACAATQAVSLRPPPLVSFFLSLHSPLRRTWAA